MQGVDFEAIFRVKPCPSREYQRIPIIRRKGPVQGPAVEVKRLGLNGATLLKPWRKPKTYTLNRKACCRLRDRLLRKHQETVAGC